MKLTRALSFFLKKSKIYPIWKFMNVFCFFIINIWIITRIIVFMILLFSYKNIVCTRNYLPIREVKATLDNNKILKVVFIVLHSGKLLQFPKRFLFIVL